EPLPLVPATWNTGGRLRSGFPIRASISCTVSSPSRPCGSDSAASRSSWACTAGSSEVAKSFKSPSRLRKGLGVGANQMWVTSAPIAHPRPLPQAGGELGRLRRTHIMDQLGKPLAQSGARNDHVDHAVLVEVFRALEALGQLLANGF